ncbi:RraA family protein [Variovorax terrae]|uniref:Putative 4-hydroxy-4-methyl-2-oxoglutarate aldolase n=1 Tax=Variovorax terrae TaxID=2923278 RepID=A0A9X2AQD7_9BURK|nr:RraA family protein [Variovorax terrae]MCJ0764452.1 RraA family protein [Variovorax terrae]
MNSPLSLGRRWKAPVVPFRIRRQFPRPEPAQVGALRGVDVTRISDLVGRMYTCDASIRPLCSPAVPVVGIATTVKCPPGDNLALMRALRMVEPGDVLVVDGQGFTQWCLGGFQLLQMARDHHGLAGIVVNGAYRDVLEAQAAGFPLYGLAVSPHSGPKLGPGEINVPVCCGGVIVHPGDVVAASGEGVAVVPRDALGAVVAALQASEPAPGAPRDDHGILDFVDDMDRQIDAWFAAGRGQVLE